MKEPLTGNPLCGGATTEVLTANEVHHQDEYQFELNRLEVKRHSKHVVLTFSILAY